MIIIIKMEMTMKNRSHSHDIKRPWRNIDTNILNAKKCPGIDDI